MTNRERYRMMTESDLHKLIPKLAVPTIISMLTTSIYNLADTYFVSQISTEASAAVGVIFSLMALIQAIGFTIGIGSGTSVSRLLGEKKQEDAEKTVSTAFFTAIAVGILFPGIGLCVRKPLVRILGAIDEVEPYAVDYVTYIFFGTPFMMGTYVLNNQMRAQGNAARSMIGILSGGLLNIALDPLFIFTFKLGISGAAIATVISQFVGFWILFFLNNKTNGIIPVRIRNFRPGWKMYGTILHGGLPSLARQGLASISSVVLNIAAGPYGASALSALSIVNRIMHFVYSALIGYGQGFQPVCGFNYGAKRYDRVMEAYRFCVKVGVIVISILGVATYLAAPMLMSWFRADDDKVIEIGITALRFQCFTLPLQAFMMMSQFLAQSIGCGIRAAVIAMSRQGLFLIPAYLILPRIWDIFGLQISQPCSDVITAALSAVVVLSVWRNLKRQAENVPSEPQPDNG